MSEKHLSPAQHETADVTPSFIWWGTASIVALVLVMAWLAWVLFPDSLYDRSLRTPLPRYPPPQLQVSPRADMERFYAEEMHRLNSTGWIDKERGIVHIPISEAMRRVAMEGIPGWPSQASKPP